jgi:hypothetical protein
MGIENTYNTGRLLSSAATTNATVVKNSSGDVQKIILRNTSASDRFLKLYDKATAPTVGTDTPRDTYSLPAGGYLTLDVNEHFVTGIAYAITGAAADADTTPILAGDIVCMNIHYN